MKTWLKKPLFKWLCVLLIVAASYGGYRIYKEITMPPPLVYLIPEEYFGPVFVFFGQPDGVDVQPDPLGQSVWVPENGVVKLKAATGVVMGTSSETHRATYMVSVSKTGERKVLKMFVSAYKRPDESWWWGYLGEKLDLHQFQIQGDWKEFSFVPKHLLDERMVFNHDGCRHQGFTPHVREVMEGKMSGKEAGTPACGKFLVVTPNQYWKLPDWMWEDAQRPYGSIQEFVDEANERVKKKKEHYKLP